MSDHPQPKEDGGPAFPLCRSCSTPFVLKNWQLRNHDYECPFCKRSRQNEFNKRDPLFKEKRRRRNALPRTKAYLAEYQRSQVSPIKRAARRKVRTEVEAGRLVRRPCAICGCTKSESHHADYLKPLEITWLCRKHHVEADAMLAARKEKP